MATIVTRSGKGSPLTHAEVDSNFTNLNTDKLETAGGSMTGNLSFSDNTKAIFGAGSDLQIYHDGSNSYISDQGTGDLKIQGANVRLENPSGVRYFQGSSGVSYLYNLGDIKLNTTSTGINVTGTVTADDYIQVTGSPSPYIELVDTDNNVTTRLQSLNTSATVGTESNHDLYIQRNNTNIVSVLSTGIDVTGSISADGLTVDGSVDVNHNSITQTANSPRIDIIEADVTDKNTRIWQTAGQLRIYSISDNILTYSERIRLDHSTGDISFYEDTGTTAKFFWDASAESLGIGTSSPTSVLHVSSSNPIIRLTDSDGSGIAATPNMQFYGGASRLGYLGYAGSTESDFYIHNEQSANIRFITGTAERMRITSSGSVGIGTSSPSRKLHVSSSQQTISLLQTSSSVGQIDIQNATATASLAADGADMYFYVNSGERMRIDSSGNVGIGTSSPAALLHLESASPVIRLKDTDGAAYHQIFASLGDLYIDSDRGNNVATSSIIFRNDATERMRIDSSGNLLVGTTTTQSLGTVNSGTLIRDGFIQIASTSASANLAYFYSSSGQVGSIGTSGGDLYVGNGTRSLMWTGTSVFPRSGTGGISDATVSLGNGSNRFKDLHLSGGVVLDDNPTAVGGSVTSKTLDDYEEGTFTPTIANLTNLSGTASITRAIYTKVGNLCTIQVRISGLTISNSATDTYFSATLPTAAAMDTASNPAITGVARASSFAATGVVVNYTNGNATQVNVAFPAENVGSSGAFDITYSLTYRTA